MSSGNAQSIFVFGSNLAGRHGKGAALPARLNYGAEYGIGNGRTGNAYAIPTKGYNIETLSLDYIRAGVLAFMIYARSHPELAFILTRVGCGLAGYTDSQIAPMFRGVSDNVSIPEEWGIYLS